jgi:transcriptional regulator with XRE-family HTH domain
MKIGTLLRRLRDKKPLSTREIAAKMDVAHSTYLDWEHDKSSPSLKSYIKLARAFDVCPVELMAYLTGQSYRPNSLEEKMSMADMKEMVAYYKNYADLLKQDKQHVEAELARLQELVRQRGAAPTPGI